MDKEPFSIIKFLDFSPMAFAKVLGLALKGGVIVLLVFGVIWVKNTLFPPAPANVNTPDIKVEKGASLEYNVIQNEKGSGWETGVFGGVHNSGDEWFVGGQVTKEW